ncbi:MAG: heparan-alpha-glucosaminide N-acetyltransferase domain-containing protein [Acidobacteriota bacterium]
MLGLALDAPGHRVRHHLRGPSLTRLAYLDWLRGLAVLVMIEAHVVDAWTRPADRQRDLFHDAAFVGGLAAPLFLFVAGLSLVLAAAARLARGATQAEAARAALVRGAQVYVLALLFRVQAQILGWGPIYNLLRVDVLNVMGLGLVAAARLWAVSRRRGARILVFAVAVGACAMTTPLVRSWDALAILPDPIEAYLRPTPPYSVFTLWPWTGFVLAGALVGELVDATRGTRDPWRLHAALALAGVAGGYLAWLASFQPSIYAESTFWGSSPTFFFLRLGIVTALVPATWLAEKGLGRLVGDGLGVLGRSSLFVYWVHVELVYGGLATPLEDRLPIEASLAGVATVAALMYWLTTVKNRWMAGRTIPPRLWILEPLLRKA